MQLNIVTKREQSPVTLFEQSGEHREGGLGRRGYLWE